MYDAKRTRGTYGPKVLKALEADDQAAKEIEAVEGLMRM